MTRNTVPKKRPHTAAASWGRHFSGCQSASKFLTPRIASPRMLLDNSRSMTGAASPGIGSVAFMAGKISMGARREVVSAVTERYRSAKRAEKGRILDALCATTGWHRKHAVRALRQHEPVGLKRGRGTAKRQPQIRCDDQGCVDGVVGGAGSGVREAAQGDGPPTSLAALEQHGRLKLGLADRDRVLAVSPPKGIVRPRMGSV